MDCVGVGTTVGGFASDVADDISRPNSVSDDDIIVGSTGSSGMPEILAVAGSNVDSADPFPVSGFDSGIGSVIIFFSTDFDGFFFILINLFIKNIKSLLVLLGAFKFFNREVVPIPKLTIHSFIFNATSSPVLSDIIVKYLFIISSKFLIVICCLDSKKRFPAISIIILQFVNNSINFFISALTFSSSLLSFDTVYKFIFTFLSNISEKILLAISSSLNIMPFELIFSIIFSIISYNLLLVNVSFCIISLVIKFSNFCFLSSLSAAAAAAALSAAS